MLGVNSAEFFVLLLVCLVVLGPDGVRQALHAVRQVTAWGKSVSRRLREESQGDMQELRRAAPDIPLDFSAYDPTRIVRDAVHEEAAAWMRHMEGHEST